MKVAAILDEHTLAVTRQDASNVFVGDILTVGGTPITDPDSGEDLGVLPGLRVKVTEIHERFLVAETYRIATRQSVDGILRNRLADPPPTYTVNIGDLVVVWGQ